MFTVGIIGAGRIGKIHIENILRRIPDTNLKLVADKKIDNQLKLWAQKIGVRKITGDSQDIFNDSEINVVIIASSTDSHSEFIQKAAEAKKNIFCEKPFDTDLNRIKKTLKIVKQEKVKLMIGFNRRFDRNFSRVKEIISSGQIGVPQIIKITSRDPSPPPIDYIKVSGGIFIDMTIHDWDMAYFQVGNDIEEIYATGAALIDSNIGKVGDIDTAIAILKFKNGTLGIVDNSRQAVYGYDQRIEVFGSKGCAIAENEPSNTVQLFTETCLKQDKIPYFFLERYRESYINEMQYFFNCLQDNKEPSPNGEEGLKSVLTAIAAQKSYNEKRPVKLSELNIL
jgi:myo-inositol 2-dehydrogenase/D-chiro-inositol 1-dehydrogenase